MTIDEKASGVQRQLDLRELVKSATWKELLIELVESNSIDPWNIDIVRIANEYREAVRKMRVSDLHIPANMILASSILLRMKSDSMEIFPQQPVDEEIGEHVSRITPEVQELIPKFRMQPKRKITLDELMGALGDAMKFTEAKERRADEIREIMPTIVVEEKDDIDRKIEAAHKLIASNIEPDGRTSYSKLSRYFGSEQEALFSLFIPVLFLAYRGAINAEQKQFFGDIVFSIEGTAKTGP